MCLQTLFRIEEPVMLGIAETPFEFFPRVLKIENPALLENINT